MSRPKGSRNRKSSDAAKKEQSAIEQTLQYEKKVYDLEQLLDIAKSFCQNLDFNNLLESIVYICMAQMHVLGAEIFVRNLVQDDRFILETDHDSAGEEVSFPVLDPISERLMKLREAVTYDELKAAVPESPSFKVLDKYNPTLIVPLIQKNHLNGILLLQERIAIDGDVAYTEYERSQMLTIASLASVAINNAALVETSSTDMMTKLKLKYYFFNFLSDAIDNALSQKQKLAVLMFDIDFFKKFNDTYGHECGDFVLIGVANLIKKSLRESDVASRYGGEEFTAMLANTGVDEAMLVAERIRAAVDEHDFVFNEQHLHVTISVGVSVFDAEKNLVNSPSELVNQADQGLYASKNNGRNRVTYFVPSE